MDHDSLKEYRCLGSPRASSLRVGWSVVRIAKSLSLTPPLPQPTFIFYSAAPEQKVAADRGHKSEYPERVKVEVIPNKNRGTHRGYPLYCAVEVALVVVASDAPEVSDFKQNEK